MLRLSGINVKGDVQHHGPSVLQLLKGMFSEWTAHFSTLDVHKWFRAPCRKFLRGKSTGIPASLRRKYEVQLMQNRKVGGKPILEDAPMADSAPSGSLGGRPVQEIISVSVNDVEIPLCLPVNA